VRACGVVSTCLQCNGTGFLHGARECFKPREGKVFAQADYPQLELFTLAQCCKTWLGASRLAEALNSGLDPHLQVAALIVGIPYDEAKRALKDETHPQHKQVKEARGAGKVANFGFPGGLGINSLVAYAKKAYGVVLTPARAKQLKEHWVKAWPEMPFYFARINGLIDENTGKATVETLWTKRYRGRASYCASCNNGFQALGADCAKRAAWLLAKAMYVDRSSPLFNARAVAFIHDEFIIETNDDATAHDAAHELARLMVEGANAYLPDVQIPLSKMEPLLMRRWSKNATPTFGADGRLVPWT
jgi:DNA polymerase-1